MVKNLNNSTKVEARKEVPSQGPTMTNDLLLVSLIATIVEDLDTTPMSVRLPTKEEKILPKEQVEEKNHHQEK